MKKQYTTPSVNAIKLQNTIQTSGPEDSKNLLNGFVDANQGFEGDLWKWN